MAWMNSVVTRDSKQRLSYESRPRLRFATRLPRPAAAGILTAWATLAPEPRHDATRRPARPGRLRTPGDDRTLRRRHVAVQRPAAREAPRESQLRPHRHLAQARAARVRALQQRRVRLVRLARRADRHQ